MSVQELAAALARRCLAGVNALARDLTDRQLFGIPAYDQVPADLRETEFAGTARHVTRQLLLAIAGEAEQDVTERDGAFLRARAEKRAAEGVPLRLMIDAYLLGNQVIWKSIVTEARPEEQVALPWIAEVQMRLFGEAVSVVVDSYLAQVTAGRAEHDERRQELARALVEGAGVAEAAARAGVAVARAHLVAHVCQADGAETTLAARRSREVLRVELFRRLGTGVLTLPRPDGLVVLLPVPGTEAAVDSDAPDPLGELRRAVERVAGLAIGTAFTTEPDGIPQAADRARTIADLVVRTGRGDGVFLLDDVLLDYHLASGPGAAEALRALIEPLAARPELLTTAATFLEQRMERGRTARALHVHGNTVDNRTARIHELTGIDLRTSEGIVLMSAALLARRLAGGTAGTSENRA